MRSPAAPSRSAGVAGRALILLAALAGALAVAFVLAPRMLATRRSDDGFDNERDLIQYFRTAFVDYWSSGDRDFSPNLARIVDYWFRYHLAKGAIAAILLTVLVVLGIRLWNAFLLPRGLRAGTRVAIASAGVLVTVLGLVSLAAVMANVQGAVAPFASLLPMLPVGTTDGELADTLDQIRSRLAESVGAGDQISPPLQVMISDFSRYHVALAVVAALAAAALIGVSVLLWTKFAGTLSSEGRTRRVLGSFAVLSALFSLVVIVVVAANMSTAANPAPALLAFFKGGW